MREKLAALPVALGTAGLVAALVAAAVALGDTVGHPDKAVRREAPLFPKLQGVVAAAPLPAAAMTSSPALDAAAAPELTVAGALWSVQSSGDSNSFVIRSDPATLRTLSATRFPQSTVHCLRLCQLLPAGRVVVMPVVGWQPPTAVGQTATPGLRPAILRFDQRTGRMLTPLLVDDTKVGVATPLGAYVQVGLDTLGRLDATATHVVERISLPFDDAVVYASGLLWGFDVNDRRLVGVGPASGQIERTFPMQSVAEAELLPGGPDAVLVVPKRDNAAPAFGIYRFDTRALRLTSGTAYVGGVAAPAAWAIEGGHLWTAYGSRVLEFDAATFRMVRAYTVRGAGFDDTGINTTVPILGSRVYVSDSSTNRLVSLDLTALP